jgi:hypothetical protein
MTIKFIGKTTMKLNRARTTVNPMAPGSSQGSERKRCAAEETALAEKGFINFKVQAVQAVQSLRSVQTV